MTRTLTTASAAAAFATLLKLWDMMLAHDCGLSDRRLAAGDGSAPKADPLAREMMRRSY